MELELEQPITRSDHSTSTSTSAKKAPKITSKMTSTTANHVMINYKVRQSSKTSGSSSTSQSSYSSNGLCNRSDSFKSLEMDVPKSCEDQVRLSWVRSQIIGGNVEYDSPFGKRRLTYADHTASGRSLLYIENFIIDNVLPFYGTCN